MTHAHNTLSITLAAILLGGCAIPGPGPCDKVANTKFGDAEITSIKSISAGRELSIPGVFIGKPFFEVPASCRVKLRLYPSTESDIRAEVWFPQHDWNGKFLGIGNGGFAGSVDTTSLTVALQKGYAAASTDTGHESSDRDGSWALGQPEKIRDYGYRAIHEMTVKAKEIVKAYYGRPPSYSYFSSCSNGGRAGLMEAQRFPSDYDGIVAGAPAYYPSGMLPVWGWIQQEMLDNPGGWLSPDDIELIANAVLESCDQLDGIRDGVINHPPACDFKPESLLCEDEDDGKCLTKPQVRSLSAIYTGPGGTMEGRPNRGFERGGELGRGAWKEWFSGDKPEASLQYIYVHEFYRNLILGDPNWSLDDFEFNRDQRRARQAFKNVFDAVDPDLSEFRENGGKIILYHGWNDAAVPPQYSIDYFNAVQRQLGEEQADDLLRLYMVPGMQHCFGGPGANNFGGFPPAGDASPERNINAALEAWVEDGVAPGPITATKYSGNELKALIAPDDSEPLFSRPLCPYPQIAQWNGKGSEEEASSFTCVSPEKYHR